MSLRSSALSPDEWKALKDALLNVMQPEGWSCDGIPESEWKRFEALVRKVELDAGDVLLAAGSKDLVAALISKGYFRSFYSTEDGEEHVRNFSEPGTFLGPLVAVLKDTPSDISIEAITDAVVYAVPYRAFCDLFDVHPVWDRLGRKLAERYYLVRERHAVELLTMDAPTRLKSFLAANPLLAKHIPKKQLALYLGIRAETVTRIMKEL